MKNPLEDRKKGKRKNLLREENGQLIIPNQRLTNLNTKIVENTDYKDFEYVNRIINDISDLEKDNDFEELRISLETVGLINPVYLQIKSNGKYKIISGLRRMVAAKKIFENNKTIKARDKVVIIPQETNKELLDKISVDENAKRKNLKIMEWSWKFNNDAKKKGKTIEQLTKDYGFSRRHTLRIKKAIDYPIEIQNIIEELGPNKAELLNRLVNKLKDEEKIQDIVNKYKDVTRKDLKKAIRQVKKENIKGIEIKKTSNKTTINLREDYNLSDVPVEAKEELQNFIKELKNKYKI